MVLLLVSKYSSLHVGKFSSKTIDIYSFGLQFHNFIYYLFHPIFSNIWLILIVNLLLFEISILVVKLITFCPLYNKPTFTQAIT